MTLARRARAPQIIPIFMLVLDAGGWGLGVVCHAVLFGIGTIVKIVDERLLVGVAELVIGIGDEGFFDAVFVVIVVKNVVLLVLDREVGEFVLVFGKEVVFGMEVLFAMEVLFGRELVSGFGVAGEVVFGL